MAFKMRSGNGPLKFKQMGSSPVKDRFDEVRHLGTPGTPQRWHEDGTPHSDWEDDAPEVKETEKVDDPAPEVKETVTPEEYEVEIVEEEETIKPPPDFVPIEKEKEEESELDVNDINGDGIIDEYDEYLRDQMRRNPGIIRSDYNK